MSNTGRIIGIDLGTSTSEVACIVDGKPVIIPNKNGKLVTPSVIHIAEDGSEFIGEFAAEYLLISPERTFMEVKRLMGADEILRVDSRVFTPEALQAKLLRYLADCAETYLGEKIEGAVITVPAYFTDSQRRATAKAGELAGLQVKRILNEPTAAAMDYGLNNLSECKYILVYDFGGGTLDITVLELFEGVIDVKASCGDNHLGGKDFDEVIMRELADVRNDARALMRLKKAAEECKIALSGDEQHSVSLPLLYTNKKGRPVSIERTITRSEFEGWVADKVESTRKPMMRALSDAKLLPRQLDLVLLVGGSTRIPCVRQLVSETLGLDLKPLIDPELAVARGAAVQAGIMEGSLAEGKKLVLTDVSPFTLGIATMMEGFFDDRLVFLPIIPRNTTIPTERSHIVTPYRDYQTQVEVRAYQGDSSDPEQNEFLGKVMLTGIPSAKKGKEPIEVKFSYDMNGILQVNAKAISNNSEVSAEINTAGAKAKPMIDLSKWEEAEGARRFRPVIRKADKLISANAVAADDLELLVNRAKEALLLGDHDQAAELREEIMELINMIEAFE